ncbi:hypothetical protein ACFZAU_02070 [Streptomyces sp. NPDC008238]
MSGTGAPDGAGIYEKALFEQARTALEVYDLRLRVLRANPAALAVRGLPEDAVVGAALADLDDGIPLSPVMQEVLDSGSAVSDRPPIRAPSTTTPSPATPCGTTGGPSASPRWSTT